MADKTDAEKLFEAVSSGSVAAPAPSPREAKTPDAETPAPKVVNAKALFDDIVKGNRIETQMATPAPVEPLSAAQGRAILEKTDPRFAPGKSNISNEPTVPQQMASPIVRGLSTLGDIPNLIAGGAATALGKIPNPLDLISRTPNPSYDKFKTDIGRYYLGHTGEQGNIWSMAKDKGIVPSDPSWRPEGWLARALYDTTDLATQIVGGGTLGRILAPLKGAAPVARAHTMELPLQPPRQAMAAPSSATVPIEISQPLPAMGTRDALAPVIGGFAGSTAHSISPAKYGETAESTGMALGTMAPYIAVPKAIGSLAQKAYDYFKAPKAAETGQALAGMIGAEPRALLESHMAGREGLPAIEGWSPSPGTILSNGAVPGERNPGTALLGIERRQADKPSPVRDPLGGPESITPAELRQRNTQALQTELRVLGPDGNPVVATKEMQDRIERARGTAQRRATTLIGEAETTEAGAHQAQQLVDVQLPQIAPGERTQARSAASQRMFTALEGAEENMSTQGGRLFDAVDPDKTARVPMYRIRDALDEVKALAIERGRTDAIPKVMIKPKDDEGRIIGDKIDDFLHNWEADVPNPKFLANVPYERVKGLRTRLTTEQRAAKDPQEREFYGRLISGVDRAVAESGEGALAARYSTARDFWRDNVARPFREGAVATILKKDKEFTGAGTLMAPGERGAQNMQPIAHVVRQDPDLYRSVVDYARADMTAFTTDVNGRVNGAKLKEWIDKHSPVLDQFPELNQEFGRIAQAQRTADTYLQQAAERAPALRALADRGIKNTEDTIRHSAARFYLNAEPEDVVKRVLQTQGVGARQQAAEQVMGMLKSKEARDGLSRAYYDYVVKRALGGSERVDPKGGWKNSFTKILDEEGPIAEAWLPAAVRERMKSLDKATSLETKRQNARANDGSRSAEDLGSPDAANLSVGHRLVQSLRGDLPTALGGATAGALMGSGVGPLGTTVGAGVGAATAYLGRHAMIARTAAKEAALREAVFNPDIFEKVMSSASLDPVVRKRLSDAIRPYAVIANTEMVADRARE